MFQLNLHSLKTMQDTVKTMLSQPACPKNNLKVCAEIQTHKLSVRPASEPRLVRHVRTSVYRVNDPQAQVTRLRHFSTYSGTSNQLSNAVIPNSGPIKITLLPLSQWISFTVHTIQELCVSFHVCTRPDTTLRVAGPASCCLPWDIHNSLLVLGNVNIRRHYSQSHRVKVPQCSYCHLAAA